MTFKKGDPKPETAGRKKGTPNKLGAFAKAEAFKVYDALGGFKGFMEWAKENKSDFYLGFMARAMPKEMEFSGMIRHEIDVDGAIGAFKSALLTVVGARKAAENGGGARVIEGEKQTIEGDLVRGSS